MTCTATEGCSGATPVCDPTAFSGRGACLVCTATAGCQGINPVCLVDARGRRCVECVATSDCRIPGDLCDTSINRCVPDFGKPDAGTDGDGGVDGGVDAGEDAGVDAGLADAGLLDGGVCIVHTPPGFCSTECPRGFFCQGGICRLNGGSGPVQVTLKWNTPEDVDLHLIEPTPTGPCDVYYGNANGSACGARGQLDLDSNPGCSIDNVDIENIIYDPDGGAPSGTYQVRVDHYAHCQGSPNFVGFEVEVRVNGVRSGYCGAFTLGGPGWDAHGGANGGIQVMTFVVP